METIKLLLICDAPKSASTPDALASWLSSWDITPSAIVEINDTEYSWVYNIKAREIADALRICLPGAVIKKLVSELNKFQFLETNGRRAGKTRGEADK